MARKPVVFVLSKDTPIHLRVYVGEGFKLRDSPTRKQLHDAFVVGCRVGRRHSGRRVKCPSRIGPAKRWTTAEAWEWYLDQLNGEE